MAFLIQVSGRRAWPVERDKLTAGSRGIQCAFDFYDLEEGLEPFAIFKAYEAQEVRPVIDGRCEIPAGVLTKGNVKLWLSVYCITANGTPTVPTAWIDLGTIAESGDMSESDNYDVPGEALSAQILALAKEAQYAAAIAQSGVGTQELTFTVDESGHLIETRRDAAGQVTADLGSVSAYAQAVDSGMWTGTLEEFIELFLENAKTYENLQQALADIAQLKTDVAAANDTANSAAALAASQTDSINRNTVNISTLKADVAVKQAQNVQVEVQLTAGVTGWNATIEDVTDEAAVICTPVCGGEHDSYALWNDCGIRCTAQEDGKLTFAADSAPVSNVYVNVLILQ